MLQFDQCTIISPNFVSIENFKLNGKVDTIGLIAAEKGIIEKDESLVTALDL